MGIDSLLIPEEHGGLDAGLLLSPPCGWSWDVWGHQPMCVPVAGRVQYLPARRHTRADRKIMAFRGTGKQMWNSAITERARAPTWVA